MSKDGRPGIDLGEPRKAHFALFCVGLIYVVPDAERVAVFDKLADLAFELYGWPKTTFAINLKNGRDTMRDYGGRLTWWITPNDTFEFDYEIKPKHN
jgi:hypothetical protein